jgi:hypothetical protein
MGEGLGWLQSEGIGALVSEVRGISPLPEREARLLGRDLRPDVPGIVPVLGVGIILIVDDAVAVVLGAG